MIDALRMDYIRTARAKGLTEKVVIYSHAFRNSMIPFMTILISWFLSLFGGSVMIETIFNWNGMGKLYISSITAFDFAVALSLGMFYVLIGLIGNLIIDIVYTFVDPRIRFT
jgi:peptide/nickel transport system permease protein